MSNAPGIPPAPTSPAASSGSFFPGEGEERARRDGHLRGILAHCIKNTLALQHFDCAPLCQGTSQDKEPELAAASPPPGSPRSPDRRNCRGQHDYTTLLAISPKCVLKLQPWEDLPRALLTPTIGVEPSRTSSLLVSHCIYVQLRSRSGCARDRATQDVDNQKLFPKRFCFDSGIAQACCKL